ncbi:hypothetical protein APTSU1_001712400 [Apodemus speciosus]|uniref:Uncharacterized protein n=1 Tax=Apodemus speciosus TaxID=105296 RepID=A0ABQ0FS33_APOSI
MKRKLSSAIASMMRDPESSKIHNQIASIMKTLV